MKADIFTILTNFAEDFYLRTGMMVSINYPTDPGGKKDLIRVINYNERELVLSEMPVVKPVGKLTREDIRPLVERAYLYLSDRNYVLGQYTQMTLFGEFMRDECAVADSDFFVPVSVLYDRYKNRLEEIRCFPASLLAGKGTFIEFVEKLGYFKNKVGGVTGFYGINIIAINKEGVPA